MLSCYVVQRLASGITTYQSRLLQVVNDIMAPVPLTREQQVRQHAASSQHPAGTQHAFDSTAVAVTAAVNAQHPHHTRLGHVLQTMLPPGCNEPPNLDLTILMDVPGAKKGSRPPTPLRAKSPDAELAALVSAIQANNSRLREVDHLMDDTTHNIAYLQVRG